ncbi:MAG: hypothetical protein ACPLW6_01345 [Desulfurella sp.]|uniref:hypothetical protein n=1 Tax=Desulfurella sp. TaxID=1962857 RepID=UPI003C763974
MSYIETLKNCAKDKKRGSLDIALDIIEASFALANLNENKKLIVLLKEIIKKQPSMALVINVCFKIIDLLKKDEIQKIAFLKQDLLDFIQESTLKASKFLDGKSVCTISYSKEVFLSIAKSLCKTVYIGIGHPKKEGEAFALDLKKIGKNVVVFEDNNYLFGAKMCDVFLSGADALFDDFFVNKSQTFCLCLLARYFKKPFYVIANKYKYLPDKLKNYYKILQMPKSEVTKKDLDTYNVYFEEIPLEFVTLIGG